MEEENSLLYTLERLKTPKSWMLYKIMDKQEGRRPRTYEEHCFIVEANFGDCYEE